MRLRKTRVLPVFINIWTSYQYIGKENSKTCIASISQSVLHESYHFQIDNTAATLSYLVKMGGNRKQVFTPYQSGAFYIK